ncbi:MAG: inositol monophosphatase [Candidatus Eremiobacteraeota bacterium]|nr:inositol monophosphatase [Candidatus Eremiobacteraeota bacterium]
MKNLLASAEKAAKAAGAIIKNRFETDFQVDLKGPGDLVTEVDRACEDKIRSILAEEHPEIAFWGEESGSTDRNATYSWVVDPLDGTKNFVHGYPFVAVSIGLVRNSHPILGVVYDPLRDELFSAYEGRGTTLNGRPVSVSQTSKVNDALIVTALNSMPKRQMELIWQACMYCQGVRRGGAAALDLAQIAAGRVDAAWEWSLHPWDLAAAYVLITEAQGTVTQPDGKPFDLHAGRVLATNTNLHRAFSAMVNSSAEASPKSP